MPTTDRQRPAQRGITALTLLAVAILHAKSVDSSSAGVTDSLQRAILEMYTAYKTEAFAEAPEVTVAEYLAMRDTGKVVLVDVRESKEMAVSVIPGSITRRAFEKNIDKYRDHAVVSYCTIGYRSGEYTLKLRERGLRAYNLVGSVLSWAQAGSTFVDKHGAPTRRVHVYGKQWDMLPENYQGTW